VKDPFESSKQVERSGLEIGLKSVSDATAVSNELPVNGATTANPGASKAAISFHYDAGNEFFRLFLDRECCYSCAMYDTESDSLEEAQQRKLEYHIQQAHADGAARVLDIGCGWGALQKKLVKEHRVKVAVGLTLSENQAEWIRLVGLPGVEVSGGKLVGPCIGRSIRFNYFDRRI
jgi:Mycolic acid cyclopropane synthetase